MLKAIDYYNHLSVLSSFSGLPDLQYAGDAVGLWVPDRRWAVRLHLLQTGEKSKSIKRQIP